MKSREPNRSPTPEPMHRRQVRAVDQFAIETLGLPGAVLMENAGGGVADCLIQRGAQRVLIVCGKGNNGGDGYVIARRLTNAGVAVRVASTTDSPLTGDAGIHQSVWMKMASTTIALPAEFARDGSLSGPTAICSWSGSEDAAPERLLDAFQPDWIVDAMLGTGAHGPPRAPVAEILPVLNRHSAKRLAVDLPSGMDCDTGEVAGAVFQADVTCTFVAPKAGFSRASSSCLGKVVVLGIGAPAVAIQHGYQVGLS